MTPQQATQTARDGTAAQAHAAPSVPRCPLCSGPTQKPGAICLDCAMNPLPAGRFDRNDPEQE